ncbi:hypothetical protein DFS33DRAFT_16917 [Desarmillaria ectypa]|nr:hypothetical protein DFS33DRAFT_16917 [Desarmillaria ectypa]
MAERLTRTTIHGPSCDPDSSAGIKSAHNCKNSGGKYYLCKQGTTWTCSAVKNMVGLEKGECFK